MANVEDIPMALKMYGVCVVCSAPGLHGRVYSVPSYMWPRNIGHCTQGPIHGLLVVLICTCCVNVHVGHLHGNHTHW